MTAGLGLLGTMRYDTPYWHMAIYMALMGLGIGMMMQNLVLCTQNQVSPQDLGSASSTVTFFRSLGGAVGVSALGAVLANRVTHYVKDGLAALGPQGSGRWPSANSGGRRHPGPGQAARARCAPSWRARTATASAMSSCTRRRAALLAFLLTLFIKEVPLKTRAGGESSEPGPAAETTAEAPAAAAAAASAGTAASRVDRRRGARHDGRRTGPPGRWDGHRARLLPRGTAVRGVVRGAEGAPVPRAAVTLISLGGRQLGRSVAQARRRLRRWTRRAPARTS